MAARKNPMVPRDPDILTEADAARYIGMSVAWLRLSRQRGATIEAPRYVKAGDGLRARVLYRRKSLDAWLESRERIPGEAA